MKKYIRKPLDAIEVKAFQWNGQMTEDLQKVLKDLDIPYEIRKNKRGIPNLIINSKSVKLKQMAFKGDYIVLFPKLVLRVYRRAAFNAYFQSIDSFEGEVKVL